MNRVVLILVLSFMSGVYGQETHENAPYQLDSNNINLVSYWYYHYGNFSAQNVVDSIDFSLEKVRIYDHKREQRGVHTYHAKVLLVGESNDGKTLTLRIIGLPIAYEVYWDGKSVGQNGIISEDKNDEIPGEIHRVFKLKKDKIYSGEHTITIRLSDHHGQTLFPGTWVFLSYVSGWQKFVAKRLHKEFFMIGIYLMTLVFSLALYLGGGRHRSFLIFLCFPFFILQFC